MFRKKHTYPNSQEFEMLEVDDNTITFTNNDILKIQYVDAHFQPHYSKIRNSVQGDKIKNPFGIIGLNNKTLQLKG